MGGFNPFSKPKVPKAPPPPPPPKLEDNNDQLTEDRLRRQRAAGTSGNTVSSLRDAKPDEEATTRISKLLG